MTTKADLINSAYTELRISGLTVNPTTEDLELALSKLENMMAEFYDRNINVNYAFEDVPDLNTKHNVERRFWESIQLCLAVRLIDPFGKEPTPTLIARSRAGFSFLSARTAPMTPVLYPDRQPIGSKNRLGSFARFYEEEVQAPPGSATHEMFVGDIDDFTESFAAWLNDGETISSYTITSNDGLTIVSDSNADNEVTYQIQADGTSDNGDDLLQVKIIVTSSDARKNTRIINFKLNSADI